MSFSWSAPQFTLEDELRERESMTAEEARQVQDDVQGSCHSGAPPAGTTQETSLLRVLHGVDEALTRIPISVKEAYLRALADAPQIVKNETDPWLFLRTDSFDVDAAARRLVRYWDWRYRLFGDRLACLPMTQQGALQLPQDRAAFRLALAQVLPKDSHGRVVLYVNRWKVPQGKVSRESYLRVIFYVCHHLATTQATTHPCQGIVVVLNMRSCDMSKPVDRRTGKTLAELFTEALPLKLQAMHCCLRSTGRNIYLLTMPAYKQLLSRHIRLRTLVHFCCEANLIVELAKYGISADSLPIELGGLFKGDDLWSWLHANEAEGETNAGTIRLEGPASSSEGARGA